MTSSLRDQTISGTFWSFIQNFGARGAGIFTTIILARLLTPKDFGLIGMLTVFISVSQGIADGGFNQALIQKKGADDEDYSSVFYINLGVSFFLYLLMYFSAPWIANFYNQPILVGMTRVLSLVFIINAFSYVQKSRLAKQLQFKKLMLIHLPSVIVSAIVAIIMAYQGYGVWSLIAQQLVMRFVYAIQIWIYAKWKPLWTFNKEKAKGLFSFGSRLMISSILNTLYDNGYYIIIGKFFSVQELGYYKNADGLIRVPSNTLSSAIKSVTFPVFSSIQNDNRRLKQGYKRIMQYLFFLITPLMIFAGVLATPLFRFVLTEKWLPAVPFFQLLCFVGIIKPLSDFNLDILNVKGRSDLYLKLNIAKKIIQTIGIVIAIPLGIWALMWFLVIYWVIKYIIHGYFCGYFINYPLKQQVLDILPIVVISAISGVIVFCSKQILITENDIIQILGGLLIGITVYWLLVKLFRISSYTEILELVKNKLSK